MKKKKDQKSKPQDGSSKNSQSSGPPFAIRLGFPKINQLWNDLDSKSSSGTLKKQEDHLYKKWGKALALLKENPFHPSLHSHEITTLSKKYRKKVFESYLENHTPSAARMFWVYGPNKAEITILALEPHPNPGAYTRIKLDSEKP